MESKLLELILILWSDDSKCIERMEIEMELKVMVQTDMQSIIARPSDIMRKQQRCNYLTTLQVIIS